MTTPARKPTKATPARKAAPARKPLANKAASRIAGVVLDLDTLSKSDAFPDLKLPKVPFTFLTNGVSYELSDPRDSDWKQALQLASNPFLLMRTALVDADETIDDPTKEEIGASRERHGLTYDTPEPGSPQEELEKELWPDGPPPPALIDRFTASPLPTWKLNALFENWHAHYKIDLSSDKGILAALLGQQ
jgi:hypothetical protein